MVKNCDLNHEHSIYEDEFIHLLMICQVKCIKTRAKLGNLGKISQ